MNLKAILAIARVTVIEQIRNRLYLIILFFGAAILASSILIGSLAPSHKVRVIFDVGMVAIELFGLATAVFGAVNLVLQEIESKTIYLIMTRPLSRWVYIVGRFLGLVVAVAVTMSAMAVLHILVMLTDPFWFRDFIEGWSFWTTYPLIVVMSMGKMLITTAVALFFSLFATSSVSALVFTGCFWMAGHFSTEVAFLIEKTAEAGPVQTAMKAVSAILPNFQYFNFRDTYAIPNFPGLEFVGWAFLYGLAYTGFFLAFSSLLFSRKEF